jgi:hypothetical protein
MAAAGTPASQALASALAEESVAPDFQVVAVEAPGFMLVSQTCDIVRTCAERPYVEVCPLQTIPEDKAGHVRAGRMPRYLWSPALGEELLAADLDQVTTLEKAGLVRFRAERRPSAATDDQARALAQSLGRKRSRAALPDDFVAMIAPLQKRVLERHGKQSDEGRLLRAMIEIRVHPRPDWSADQVEVELLLLFDSAATVPPKAEEQIDGLLKLVKPSGRFRVIAGRIVTLDTLTAATYVTSDRLDLEHLSVGTQ